MSKAARNLALILSGLAGSALCCLGLHRWLSSDSHCRTGVTIRTRFCVRCGKTQPPTYAER